MKAGMKRSQSWTFMALLMLALVMLHEVKMVGGQGNLTPSQCKEEKRLLINACRAVVYGQAASPGCCQRVRVTHFECVCPLVTPKIAALIKISQVIKVLQVCGRSVPRHFKCGSMAFP